VIYFAQADVIGLVKIGFHGGTDVRDRLRELQTGCPSKLILLGTIPGGPETEADLHRRFAFAHAHGEWFRPAPELLAFIGQQPTGLSSGATEVQSRFVQIRILTVGGNRFSVALFDQLPWRCIFDWDSSNFECLHLLGEPWGWLYRTKSDVSVATLVWECDGALYRFPINDAIPYAFHPDWIGRKMDADSLSLQQFLRDRDIRETICRRYDRAYQQVKADWLSLPQLFIGVS
jgi:hypothetical protein